MTGAAIPGPARPSLVLACAVWAGVLLASPSAAGLVPFVGALLLVHLRFPDGEDRATVRRRLAPWIVVGLNAGLLAGAALGAREAVVLDGTPVEPRPVELEASLAEDPVRSDHGVVALGVASPIGLGTVPLLLRWRTDPGDLLAGERLLVSGTLGGRPGRLRDDPYRATIDVRTVRSVRPAADPFRRTANRLRRHLLDGLGSTAADPARALIAGFLVGATDDLPPAAQDRLRRAGLSHYVAVSGSNVALFMTFLWLILGPLGMGRRRLWFGLVGLGMFVALTRWEPSVLRASAMAAVVLAGRAAGLPITTWEGLGWGTAGVLLVAPELGDRLGFQLSVAATVGILIGATRSVGVPASVRVLQAALAAQLAVAPILLATVGSVPLLSPVANVLAAPLVSAATVLGGIGAVAHLPASVALGAVAARGVLAVAAATASTPTMGWLGAAVALSGGWSAWRHPRSRPFLAVGAALSIAVLVVPVPAPSGTEVVFLDVGQGDAALIRTGGLRILVDGGRDPRAIVTALDRRGVRSLDLAILSHPHDDHARGLEALLGVLPIGMLWHPGHPEPGPAARRLLAGAAAAGIPTMVPPRGTVLALGDARLEVIGPRRRYASPNDMSIVFLLRLGRSSVLFPGDVEVIAQRELDIGVVDVLKVPHQGAATSDLAWLRGLAPGLSVVSVGPNAFGHPDVDVLAALAETGRVLRTDEVGDVAVTFTGDGRIHLVTERPP